jgi:hypothetical protein
LAYIYAFGEITLGYVQFRTDSFQAVLYRGHGYKVSENGKGSKITKQCIRQSGIIRSKNAAKNEKKHIVG